MDTVGDAWNVFNLIQIFQLCKIAYIWKYRFSILFSIVNIYFKILMRKYLVTFKYIRL